MKRAQGALNLTEEVNRLGIRNRIVLPFTKLHLKLSVAVTRAYRFALSKMNKLVVASRNRAMKLNRDLLDLVDEVLRFNKSYALRTIKITHERNNDARNAVQRLEIKNRSL